MPRAGRHFAPAAVGFMLHPTKCWRTASMMVGRLIGWVLILVGIGMLTHDLLDWLSTKVWAPLVLGELWYSLAPGSLNMLQRIVEADIAPFLWDPVITTILFCWAFAVFIVLGLLVHHLFRERTSRSF
jgi:hypothetical protein